MSNFPKPKIVISKCIGFDPCRYNGGIVQDKFVARLKPHIEVISVCPEVEIGLGIPRAPVRIIYSGDELRLVQPSSGLDLSESMRGFTSGFLDTVKKVDGFILKNRSPSCGFTDVKFYSGSERGPAIGRTAGLFGGAVLHKFSNLAVEDEGRLKNLSIREHFLTRIFALARLRELQESGSMRSLARFHSLNKLGQFKSTSILIYVYWTPALMSVRYEVPALRNAILHRRENLVHGDAGKYWTISGRGYSFGEGQGSSPTDRSLPSG